MEVEATGWQWEIRHGRRKRSKLKSWDWRKWWRPSWRLTDEGNEKGVQVLKEETGDLSLEAGPGWALAAHRDWACPTSEGCRASNVPGEGQPPFKSREKSEYLKKFLSLWKSFRAFLKITGEKGLEAFGHRYPLNNRRCPMGELRWPKSFLCLDCVWI